MPHVITAPCFGCKNKQCIKVCPVDAFHEGEKMLFINPSTCIDCTKCVAECPVEAIFADEDVPEEWKDFVELNAEMAPQCPEIK